MTIDRRTVLSGLARPQLEALYGTPVELITDHDT